MIASSSMHRLLRVLIINVLFLTWASCTLTEERIDRSAGGPNLPEDIAVYIRLDSKDKPDEMAPRTVLPGPLKITTTEAILLSLENNRSLVVERLNPSIRKTFEDKERALFDPQTNAEISAGRVEGERLARSGAETENFTSDSGDASVSLTQFFPTGTTVSLEGSTQIDDSSLYRDTFYWTRLGMSVNQAILRGYGKDVNLVRLRQARLDTRMSEYELRGFTESLVAQVEQTYWDYALASRQVEIFEESLKVARQQLNETRELIAVGRLAKSEMPAVQAEVAAQEQGLINARSDKETIRLQLLRLLNPPGQDLWGGGQNQEWLASFNGPFHYPWQKWICKFLW
jgi:outer membrane protein